MTIESADGPTLLRRALAKCEPEDVLTLVDQLNLQPSSRVDVLVVAPLRNLRRSRSVDTFAATAPLAAVRFLVELIATGALERVVTLLGEAAAEPTYDQLAEAVDQLAGEFSDRVIAVMLAAAAAGEVPAAAHCRALLAERPALALPEVVVVAAPAPLVSAKSVDPQVREQRRQRRELQRQQRQRQQSRPPSRPTRASAPAARAAAPTRPDAPPAPTVPVSDRRRAALTPLEAAEFDPEHALGGYVVEIEVPFDQPGPDEWGATGKIRPAVVVAGAVGALLVRPVFSKPAPGRTLLSGWIRLGLDHASYVQLERVRVELDPVRSLRRFGRLSDEEWNALD